MRGRLRAGAVILALALLVPAAIAGAQPTSTFGDLGLALNTGDRVRVEDRQGGRHEGTVRSLTRDTLEITAADGPHAFTADTTAKVARRGDPVWTGALIGFLPGFVMGTRFVAGFSDHEERLTTYLAAGGLVGLAGAGIGATIDSLHEGLVEVYVAGRPATVRLTPLVGRTRLGAAATMRW